MEKREKAVQLRQTGRTLRKISKILNIPVSTAHLWTKQVRLTPSQIKRIKVRHRKIFQLAARKAALAKSAKFKREEERYKVLGKQQIGRVSRRELMLIGAGLYWSEGFKKDNRLGFANSDPAMIKLFLKWLFEVGEVPRENIRLRVGVNVSYKNRVREIERRWVELTGISLDQFQKPFFQRVKWKRGYPDNGGYLGVLRIRANGQGRLFSRIKGMLEGLQALARSGP